MPYVYWLYYTIIKIRDRGVWVTRSTHHYIVIRKGELIQTQGIKGSPLGRRMEKVTEINTLLLKWFIKITI